MFNKYNVIAQYVEKIAPELVNTDENGIKSVNYLDLIIAKINTLEEKVKLLETKIKKLKSEKINII